MQCWHQRVRVTPAEADEYGDVVVDTAKSREAYLDWMSKTRPAGPPMTRVCAVRSGTPVPSSRRSTPIGYEGLGAPEIRCAQSQVSDGFVM